jgi:methionyl-tRNA formyltransferase
MTPTPVAAWAAEHAPAIPVLKPERVNETEVVAGVRAFPGDAWVVIAFGQKLGKALLAERFAVNLHASLLPRWRGAAPINAAIVAGDAETGNSVITLADRMDAGLVLGTSRRAIEPPQTAGELHDLLAADGPALMVDVLQRHAAGSLHGEVQDESLVTIAHKMSKAEGWVDWTRSAPECRNRIHGLTPWPGVTVRIGAAELKLCRVHVGPQVSESVGAGAIVDATRGLVACGDGTTIGVLEVLPAGKRLMNWSDFVRGHRVARGDLVCSAKPATSRTTQG